VEAMADAVEGAAAMCYGVSRAYKESANCRLEAQYAYQREKDMVPLMVEEGYRADGWLGMLLGARLYYVLYGSTVSSEAAFEGKMEELCRELGERGKGGATPDLADSLMVDISIHQQGGEFNVALAQGSQRIAAMEDCLECMTRLLLVVPRQERKMLLRRGDAIQQALEQDDPAQWVLSAWSRELSRALIQAVVRVRTLGSAEGTADTCEAIEACTALLTAIDNIVAAHVDRAEALMQAMEGGTSQAASALESVLEHAVQVLDVLSTKTPRRDRRAVRALCERVEAALESVGGDLAEQLLAAETSALVALCACLSAAEALVVEESTHEEILSVVKRMMETLEGCQNKP
jgi:hypothetical protein